MNILIPFRNTSGFSEIDMCIKLINKNLKLEFDNIYIIGDLIPGEYNKVINIEVEEQKYNKWLDSNFLTEYYCKNIGKPFILFNDDFFLTSEVVDIPSYYYKTLLDRSLTTYCVDYDANKIRPSAYGLNILKFIEIYGDFNNFETHIPIIIEYPEVMIDAIKLSKEHDCPSMKRTLYRYLSGVKGLEINEAKSIEQDVKFREPLTIIQYPFFSLTDKEFLVFEEQLIEILER